MACTTALLISKEFEPHVVQIGWGFDRDINSAQKYFREFSLNLVASARRLVSQKSTTLDLTRCLNLIFVGGYSRSVSGEGMQYCRQSSLTWKSQEPEDGFADVSWYAAILFTTDPGSLQIIPKRESILR